MDFLLAAAPQGGMGIEVILIYVVAFAAFIYFVMVRPQKKQEKQQKALMESLAVGDFVMTTSGFYGEIIDITNDMVIIEFGSNKNCRIPMQKEYIAKTEKPGVE